MGGGVGLAPIGAGSWGPCLCAVLSRGGWSRATIAGWLAVAAAVAVVEAAVPLGAPGRRKCRISAPAAGAIGPDDKNDLRAPPRPTAKWIVWNPPPRPAASSLGPSFIARQPRPAATSAGASETRKHDSRQKVAARVFVFARPASCPAPRNRAALWPEFKRPPTGHSAPRVQVFQVASNANSLTSSKGPDSEGDAYFGASKSRPAFASSGELGWAVESRGGVQVAPDATWTARLPTGQQIPKAPIGSRTPGRPQTRH